MAIKTVMFDLDGTLLPMDQEAFTKIYFTHLAAKTASLGYDPTDIAKNIWTCVASMIHNDGTKANVDVFWENFCKIYGENAINDKPKFDEFYSNEFHKASAACSPTPSSREIIDLVKSKGVKLVLATNPIFPAIATETRIGWAGLEVTDFEYYTAYENAHFSKPNPKYYAEICEKLNLDPKECLMIGNDAIEDTAAETLGIKVFILTNCLLNGDKKDISAYPHGDFSDLKAFLESNI